MFTHAQYDCACGRLLGSASPGSAIACTSAVASPVCSSATLRRMSNRAPISVSDGFPSNPGTGSSSTTVNSTSLNFRPPMVTATVTVPLAAACPTPCSVGPPATMSTPLGSASVRSKLSAAMESSPSRMAMPLTAASTTNTSRPTGVAMHSEAVASLLLLALPPPLPPAHSGRCSGCRCQHVCSVWPLWMPRLHCSRLVGPFFFFLLLSAAAAAGAATAGRISSFAYSCTASSSMSMLVMTCWFSASAIFV